MIVVIQCAATKQPHAGQLRTLDGRKVMFVAQPKLAPTGDAQIYASPDDNSDRGDSWRTILERYNAAPGESLLGLLPAWCLYKDPTYELLARCIGPERLYILSAGWGLARADYLTPNYDITFSKARNVAKFKQRRDQDTCKDFELASGMSDPLVFFGGRDYIPLFTKLTANAKGPRTVFYAGSGAAAPGCMLQRFGNPFTNWYCQCAKNFLEQGLASGKGQNKRTMWSAA